MSFNLIRKLKYGSKKLEDRGKNAKGLVRETQEKIIVSDIYSVSFLVIEGVVFFIFNFPEQMKGRIAYVQEL
jgi:hypothetical protein